MTGIGRKVSRGSFWRKVAAASLLVALADMLFFGEGVGATIGVFAVAWTITLLVSMPGVRRAKVAKIALLVAGLFALALIDDPKPLSWALLWIALSSAALLARYRFDDSARWALRLIGYAIVGIAGPIVDCRPNRAAPRIGRREPSISGERRRATADRRRTFPDPVRNRKPDHCRGDRRDPAAEHHDDRAPSDFLGRDPRDHLAEPAAARHPACPAGKRSNAVGRWGFRLQRSF